MSGEKGYGVLERGRRRVGKMRPLQVTPPSAADHAHLDLQIAQTAHRLVRVPSKGVCLEVGKGERVG